MKIIFLANISRAIFHSLDTQKQSFSSTKDHIEKNESIKSEIFEIKNQNDDSDGICEQKILNFEKCNFISNVNVSPDTIRWEEVGLR